MDLDSPREILEWAMSVDNDDGATSRHDYERLPSPRNPRLMTVILPSSPVDQLGETGDLYQHHESAGQYRHAPPILEPPLRGDSSRKRKHAHDSPIPGHHDTRGGGAFADSADSQSSRRIRPRLRRRPQDREFSPLLYLSSSPERELPAEEEMIMAHHYPAHVTDPSQRFYPRDTGEPRMLQSGSSSLPPVDDLEDREEHDGRSDSADSFAQVALASTTGSKTSSRLSSLQDFGLLRPFEETEHQSVGSIKVHQRGIEAPPFFLNTATMTGRSGGGLHVGTSRELAPDLPTEAHEHGIHATGSATRSPGEGFTTFFDKPICDSPDQIDPAEGR